MVELLVVISIIGLLIGLSIFGLQGARETSRDSKRKADLEQIRSGLEIYKSDCDGYPVGSGNPTAALGNPLMGDDTPPSCASTNTYISQVPQDPTFPNNYYQYYSEDGSNYEICAYLEQLEGAVGVTCGAMTACGGSANCNYKVTNP